MIELNGTHQYLCMMVVCYIEKTEYILMSCYQNKGPSHDVRIINHLKVKKSSVGLE